MSPKNKNQKRSPQKDKDHALFQKEKSSRLSEKALRDLEIVERAREGDEAAFTELFELYKHSLYYMILRMVNNPHDAEDLTLEAFGKAFRNIHQYRPRYAFSSWLFRIATNNCIDFIRKKRLELVNYDDVTPSTLEWKMRISAGMSRNLDLEEGVILREDIARLKEYIGTLRDRYQELIRLRYFEEYTYEEISVALDLPLGTVKAQLFRARKCLQPLIERLQQPE